MAAFVGIDRAMQLMQSALEYLTDSQQRASSMGNVEGSECVGQAIQEVNAALVWCRQSKAEGAT